MKKVKINEQWISPIEMTSKFLFKRWKPKKEEKDLTITRIEVDGKLREEKIRYSFDLYDEYDVTTGTHNMHEPLPNAASIIVVRVVKSGLIKDKGLFFPEQLGKQEVIVGFMLVGLAQRKVIYKKEIIYL